MLMGKTVVQIRRGNGDNLGIISHIFFIKTFCDLSLEPIVLMRGHNVCFC